MLAFGGWWRALFVLLAACAGALGSVCARDYLGPPLSAEEQRRALSLVTAGDGAAQVQKELAPFLAESAAKGELLLVDVQPRLGGGAFEGQRMAVLRHVQYRQNGIFLTLRSVVTLKADASRFVGVTIRTHQTTPAAPEEIARAGRIVLQRHPSAAARFGGVAPTLTILVPVVGRSSSPTYGHRLLDVWFGEPDPEKLLGPYRARVDLSVEDDADVESLIQFYED